MTWFLIYVEGSATEYLKASDYEGALSQAEIKWQGYIVDVAEVEAE